MKLFNRPGSVGTFARTGSDLQKRGGVLSVFGWSVFGLYILGWVILDFFYSGNGL
jgi:hypothetical protein